jgi:HEAT repeat protein
MTFWKMLFGKRHALKDGRYGEIPSLVTSSVPSPSLPPPSVPSPSFEQLSETLLHGGSERLSAARELSKSDDPRLPGLFLKVFKSNVSYVAEEILGTLERLGYMEELSNVILCKYYVQEHSPAAIRIVGQARITKEAFDALSDDERSTLIQYHWFNERLNADARIMALTLAMNYKTLRVRAIRGLLDDRWLRDTLSRPGIDFTSGIEAIAKALTDEDQEVRAAAATGLGRLDPKRLVEALLIASKDSSVSVRTPALCSLAGIGDPKTLPVLFAALKDDAHYDSTTVGYAVQKALRRLDKPACAEGLNRILESNDGESVAVALDALNNIGKPPPLVSLLHLLEKAKSKTISCHYELLPAIVRSINCLRDVRAVDPLVALLDDEAASYEVREAAAIGLGQIGSSRAIPCLLSHFRGGVREATWAAPALGMIADSDTLNIMIDTFCATDAHHLAEAICESIVVFLNRCQMNTLSKEVLQRLASLPDKTIVNPGNGDVDTWHQYVKCGKIRELSQRAILQKPKS